MYASTEQPNLSYEMQDGIAMIVLDDGKVNALTPSVVSSLSRLLDRAEQEAKTVILTGKPGKFCAGFDLKIVEAGGSVWNDLYSSTVILLERIYSFPRPVVCSCTGHAIGLGAFLVFVSDYRIGVEDNYLIGLPETKIGVGFTPALIAIAEANLTTKYRTRMALQSESIGPAAALDAGIFDEVISNQTLLERTLQVAQNLSRLNATQYAENKLAIRAGTLNSIRSSIKSGKM